MLTVLGAVAIDLLPLPHTAPGVLVPSLLVGVSCFWTIHRPDLLPPALLFAVGMLADAAGGAPVGVTALCLLVARLLLVPWRRFLARQAMVTVWLPLLPVLLAVGAARWVLMSALSGAAFPLWPVLIEAGLTFAAYPAIAGLLAGLQRRPLPSPHAARG
jgi:rod shape-determining protein MreD